MNMRRMVAAALAVVSVPVWAAHPASEWAREEFEDCCRKVFGHVPEVSFVLPGEASGFEADFAALKGTDGYAVRRRGKGIVFVADCPKGHVNGVHRWLERNSDIVWPRPAGDMCFFTPSKKTVGELDCDYIDIPVFRIRYFGGGAPDGETKRYLARNAVSPTAGVGNHIEPQVQAERIRYGINGAYCDVYGGGHDMETRWFPRSEFFKDHPEYWMEIDGERWTGAHSNFCETNPEFVKAYCGSVLDKIAKLPQTVKIISINMEDTRKTCTCRNCIKPIRLADGTMLSKDDPAFASTRFFIFFNEVARAVAKARSDLKILQFAYHHLTIPPKVPVERNVILKFCPYPRNMRESVMVGDANAKWRDRVNGWLANTPELYWREYYFCQCITYPRPMADTAAIDLREISKRGVKYVYTDSPSKNGDGDRIITMYSHHRPAREFFDMCAMEAWTIEKLFWNPALDPETLRADFLRRTFGPSAAHLAAFFKTLRDSWYSENHWSSFNDSSARSAARYVVSKKLEGKCLADLEAALGAADLPERKAWIAKMIEVFGMWVREAPNFMDCEIAVPEIDAPAPDADGMEIKQWRKAAWLPSFAVVRYQKMIDKSGTQAAICSDGSSFNILFDVKKSGALRVRQAGDRGEYPAGDKVEVSFASGGKYWQFAVGAGGDMYAAQGAEGKFAGKWTAKTQKTATGWRAVMKIPFASIGFEPAMNPSIRFNAMVSYSHGPSAGEAMNYSLGGAMPHAPKSWSALRVKIAFGD